MSPSVDRDAAARGMPSDGSTGLLAFPVVVGIAPDLDWQPAADTSKDMGLALDAHSTFPSAWHVRTTRLLSSTRVASLQHPRSERGCPYAGRWRPHRIGLR
jgi:hypothetical protein